MQIRPNFTRWTFQQFVFKLLLLFFISDISEGIVFSDGGSLGGKQSKSLVRFLILDLGAPKLVVHDRQVEEKGCKKEEPI